MRASRDEWQKRVEQWTQSGLSAVEFAAGRGISAATLQKWKDRLRGQGRGSEGRRAGGTRAMPGGSELPALPLLEVHARPAPLDERFEVELVHGLRVRVPGSFEADALRRLLKVLEGAS